MNLLAKYTQAIDLLSRPVLVTIDKAKSIANTILDDAAESRLGYVKASKMREARTSEVEHAEQYMDELLEDFNQKVKALFE